ncbi:hypothetical protein ACVWWO_006433 [Bradyrhizobium sp. F1.13.1]
MQARFKFIWRTTPVAVTTQCSSEAPHKFMPSQIIETVKRVRLRDHCETVEVRCKNGFGLSLL